MNDIKRNPTIAANITLRDDSISGVLELYFNSGVILTLDTIALSPEVRQQALLHGLKQKLVDAAAISRNTETGRAATVEDKYQAVKTVYDRLLAGAWNATREGGGATGGLLAQALTRMYAGRKTAEDIKAFLAEKSDAEKTALRKNPRVAQIIEDIRAEQGKAANIDTDELLGELG